MKYCKIISFLILLLSSALISRIAHSQDKSNPSKEPEDESVVVCRHKTVWIDVEVRDSDGNEVKDLTKDDFTIYEDGEKQVLCAWQRNEFIVDNQPRTRYAVVYYYSYRKPIGYRKVRVLVQAKGKPRLRVKISPEEYYATKDGNP